MLDEICRELKNYFETGIYHGVFEIRNGTVSPSDFLLDGQYFRIVGSVFNDGIYKGNGAIIDPNFNICHNETFAGEVCAMAVPPAVIALAEEIERFNKKVDELCLVEKGFASESFGGYSYTLGSSAPPAMSEWAGRISKKMNRWRKI